MNDPETPSNGFVPDPPYGGVRPAAGAPFGSTAPGSVMPDGPRAVGNGPVNTLGKYRLVAELARGNMGLVYLGVAQGPAGFSKLFVIKELRPEMADDQDFLRMFLDEARLAARLNHANIVQTYEVDGEGSRYFMAMEYLEGQTLHRLLDLSRRYQRATRPPRALLLRVLSEVLSGLHHAHELCDFDGTPLGVVHRDVSPRNVFLTYDGRAKLMDFGIAKAKDALHVTVAGMLKGKVTYMAPEQAMNLPVDRRADVFAAGVILWESLVGRKLWDKVPLNEVLLRLSRHDLPPAPSVLVADLPSELDRICARALAPHREARYATALEFREDLERYLTESGDEVHPREVGQYLATTFADERAAQRAFVEANVRRQPGEGGGELAKLPGPEPHESAGRIRAVSAVSRTLSGAPMPPQAPFPPPVGGSYAPPAGGSYPPPSGGMFPPPASGMYPPPPGGMFPPPPSGRFPPASGPLPAPGHSSNPPPNPLHSTSPTLVASSARPPPPTRPRSLWLVATFAVVGSLASASIGVLLAVRAEPSPPATTSAAPSNAASAPGSSAPASPFVAFTLHVTPPQAHVFLDDVELPPEAWNGLQPRDGQSHRIRVEAEGYVPRTQLVKFNDSKLALTITLDKRSVEPPTPPPPPPPPGPRPRHSRAAPPPAHAPEAAAPEAAARGLKPKRSIDASNPYGAD
jgi:serine/threonine-protein kinase